MSHRQVAETLLRSCLEIEASSRYLRNETIHILKLCWIELVVGKVQSVDDGLDGMQLGFRVVVGGRTKGVQDIVCVGGHRLPFRVRHETIRAGVLRHDYLQMGNAVEHHSHQWEDLYPTGWGARIIASFVLGVGLNRTDDDPSPKQISSRNRDGHRDNRHDAVHEIWMTLGPLPRIHSAHRHPKDRAEMLYP